MQYSGIYWMGPVADIGGYGNVSRNFLKSIQTLGVPVFIHNIGNVHAELGESAIAWLNGLSTPDIGDKVIVFKHITADGFSTLQPMLPLERIAKTIGVTIFETDRISHHWVEACNNTVDEVWVPSAFNINTFTQSGVSPSKLKLVPYSLDTSLYYPEIPYVQIGNIGKGFNFLYNAAYGYRKGFDLLIKAFCEEFTGNDDVSLILKVDLSTDAYGQEAVMQTLGSYIHGDNPPKIDIILGKISYEQLIGLYKTIDVYVSTDRANGWGMPCFECMALGKPTATIDWSGSTEFMNESNSFLIKPEDYLEDVDMRLQTDRYAGHHYAGHKWAVVGVSEVCKVLREAYADDLKRERIAKQAAQDIKEKYSLEKIGEIIQETLEIC